MILKGRNFKHCDNPAPNMNNTEMSSKNLFHVLYTLCFFKKSKQKHGGPVPWAPERGEGEQRQPRGDGSRPGGGQQEWGGGAGADQTRGGRTTADRWRSREDRQAEATPLQGADGGRLRVWMPLQRQVRGANLRVSFPNTASLVPLTHACPFREIVNSDFMTACQFLNDHMDNMDNPNNEMVHSRFCPRLRVAKVRLKRCLSSRGRP